MNTMAPNKSLHLDKDLWITLSDFIGLVKDQDTQLTISETSIQRLDETRNFIHYLIENQIKAYGLTTGFADLRNTSIPSEHTALLSKNLIRSHDAGIGDFLPYDVTLGAMIIRAHSLSKGYSGFSEEALAILIRMINAKIVPCIPSTGSLGASGDLAYLARLGRAMMGEDVHVWHKGKMTKASEALSSEAIPCFEPKAKEGLALTNGTPFMASMLALGIDRQLRCMNNLLQLTGLFLNSVGAVDAAFYDSINQVRYQEGQLRMAQLLKQFLTDSMMIDHTGIQNDYCVRCLPQIYGPRFELILEQISKVERELNAVTDNPLIFRDEEISEDVDRARIFSIEGKEWAILSGGNFHGENLTAIADIIALSNAKIALTIERQITYLMNPFRNQNTLPIYLIAGNHQVGLKSGFMISHYTANALAHKMCLLGQSAGLSNITSANESEDVVSYGATACHKLLEQLELFRQLLAVYLLATAQAYALKENPEVGSNPQTETVFRKIQEHLHFPQLEDESFDKKYAIALSILDSGILGSVL